MSTDVQDGLGFTETGSLIAPREYQDDAITEVLRRYQREGVRRILGVAATGLGKTIIFGKLAERMQARALILSHRDELVQQAAEKVRMCWPGITVGIVKAEQNETRAPVVSASVQTVAGKKRLVQLAAQPWDLVVVDEAHHSVAASYRRVLEAVGCGPDLTPWYGDAMGWERPLLLGVTATPDRGDRVALKAVFDEVAFVYDMRWGIVHGYLSDIVPFLITLDLDLDKIKVTAGDFDDAASGSAIIEAGGPMAAVDAYNLHAPGRKALVFTPDVRSAGLFAQAFNQEGIPAAMVSGMTPLEERRQILRDFTDGKIRAVANCAVLTEGYDEPSVDCVILARPTKSRALYTQMLGRGVRLFPGKEHCVAIDLVGMTSSHELVTVGDLFGLPLSALRESKGSVLALLTAAEEEKAAKLARAGQIRSEVVDLWASRRARANFAWVATAGGKVWVLNIGTGFVALEPDGPDTWRAVVKEGRSGFRRIVQGVDLAMAQGTAEDFVRAKAWALVKKDARWREGSPNDKQAAAVRSWGGNPEGMTAGQASDFLSAKIAAKELRGARR